jgi:hypothetical protein
MRSSASDGSRFRIEASPGSSLASGIRRRIASRTSPPPVVFLPGPAALSNLPLDVVRAMIFDALVEVPSGQHSWHGER